MCGYVFYSLFPQKKQVCQSQDDASNKDVIIKKNNLRASDAPHYHLYSLTNGNGEYIGGAFSKHADIRNLYDQYGPIEEKYWKIAANAYINMSISQH